MPPLSPIYTLDNCHAAYQLNWSLSVFWHQPPTAADWLDALQTATEPDGVRVLEHRLADERMSQFLVSTKPAVSPHALVRTVKGRLQYLVRGERPKAFHFRAPAWCRITSTLRWAACRATRLARLPFGS